MADRTRQIDPVSGRYYYPQSGPQRRTRLVTEEYEYDFPFKYPNITVERFDMMGREYHGVEMNAVNMHHPATQQEQSDLVGDSILVEEVEHPMVRVVTIGSACTPPGWVQIECEPVPEWRNRYELPSVLPVRFRVDGLWGMHDRVDRVLTRTPDVEPTFNRTGDEPYEQLPEGHFELHQSARGNQYLKGHYRENPLAGMSCAVFEIPPSLKVWIQAGSQIPAWRTDNFPGDHHYSLRHIRTAVLVRREEG